MANMVVADIHTLRFHLKEVLEKRRRFENVFQAVTRMILDRGVEKVVHAGRPVYDFKFFREGGKHIIAWYDEITEFVSFVKGAAQGGDEKERAFAFVGEPGNGKTFIVDFLCNRYRRFLSKPENAKFTFKFVGLDEALKYDPKVSEMHSLTFEDPMILAMNLFDDGDESRGFISKSGFNDKDIEAMFKTRRPLGASSEYLWRELRNHFDGDVNKMLEHVMVIPVPMSDSLGTTTGKYSAKDKITSSSVDLLGEESLQHLLLLNLGDPNKFDLRRGALARVGGSGIHFSDEIFKNKIDLVQVYLAVIQNRRIEIDGFLWYLDTLIVATSNNHEYNRFVSEKEQKPIKDRFTICFVGHNTDYKLQHYLTEYALGDEAKFTFLGEPMHKDPNLNFALSVGSVLTRLPKSEKLTPIETMKLAAGEIAGEKGTKTLAEVWEALRANADVTKRWGQKGLGQRDLGKAITTISGMTTTNDGKCMCALDAFKAFEYVVLDYVDDNTDRIKYLDDLKIAKKLYREQIKSAMFNAFMNDPQAIRKDVMNYVNMIIGIDAPSVGPDKMWTYNDPQTKTKQPIKIDERYINSVEERIGLRSKEMKDNFRNTIRKIYGQKITTDPNYDFMDNQDLVKAVTDVRLKSDVASAGSLVGALANRTNEENQKIYNRMIETMLKILGYCPTCAQKTIEYFCTQEDEN